MRKAAHNFAPHLTLRHSLSSKQLTSDDVVDVRSDLRLGICQPVKCIVDLAQVAMVDGTRTNKTRKNDRRGESNVNWKFLEEMFTHSQDSTANHRTR